MPFLQYAHLVYGSTKVPVPPTEQHPLPGRFDFHDPVGCAKMICAIMSNACGGQRLLDCRVRLHLPTQRANVLGHGFHVYYGPTLDRPLTPAEALQIVEETSVTHLGLVQASGVQGDGWRHARWTPSQLEYIPPARRVRESA